MSKLLRKKKRSFNPFAALGGMTSKKKSSNVDGDTELNELVPADEIEEKLDVPATGGEHSSSSESDSDDGTTARDTQNVENFEL